MAFVFDFKGRVDNIEPHFEIEDVLTFLGFLLHKNRLYIDFNILLEVFARLHLGKVEIIIVINL
jgi:hypothetical protein